MFFIGGNPQDTAIDLATRVNQILHDPTYYSSEHAFTIKNSRTGHQGVIPVPNIQFIKRVYTSPLEVIAGFDLDSSAVLARIIDGNLQLLATQAYVTSVTYGINVINPNRQKLHIQQTSSQI